MDIEKIKALILSVYPHWERKLSKMKKEQIVAIYMRLKGSGKLP